MAQLTWRNIEAPNLSTRDIALAGQTMVQGFDRLAQTLTQRELNLRQAATDKAIAERLALQDPNQMGALDLTKLGGRVDVRAVAEADNAHRLGLMQRAEAQENLLNAQADAKFGTVIAGLADAALKGDANAEAQLRGGAESDPMFARALARHYKTITDFRDQGIDNRLARDEFGETRDNNLRADSRDRARISIADRQVRLRENEVADAQTRRLIEADTRARAVSMASDPNIDPATAKKWAAENLPADQLEVFNGAFDTTVKTFSTLSPEQQGLAAGLAGQKEELQGIIEAQRREAVAANRAKNPEMDAIARYQENIDTYSKMTPDDAIKAIEANIQTGLMATGGSPLKWGDANTLFRQMRAKGLQPGEIVAALESGYGGRSWWENQTTFTGGRQSLLDMADAIAAAKKPGGYDAFIADEQRRVTGPYDSEIARMDQALARTTERIARTARVETREGPDGRPVIDQTAPAEDSTREFRLLLEELRARRGDRSGQIVR